MLKMPKMLRMPPMFQMQTDEFNHEGLFYHNSRGQKRWAAVVPPGGLHLNPPPTEGEQGVSNQNFKFLPKFAFSKLLLISPISRGFWPLSFSLPSRPRIPQGQPKMGLVYDLDDHFPNFLSFQNVVRKMLRKTSKKVRKSTPLAFQKPPNTHPKSIPNRRSKKHVMFRRFFGQTL